MDPELEDLTTPFLDDPLRDITADINNRNNELNNVFTNTGESSQQNQQGIY